MKLAFTAIATFLAITTAPVMAMAEEPPAFVISQLQAYQKADETTNKNLKTFDTLDFDV